MGERVWDEGYEVGYDDAIFDQRGLSTDSDADQYPHENPYRGLESADIDVAALRAAAEGATPGPWEQLEHEPQQVDAADQPVSESWLEQDAAYIAAANPAVVLALLDRLADVEVMLERTEAQIHEPGGFIDQVVVPSYSDGLRWAADVAHAEARWQWEQDGRTPSVPGAQIVAQRAQVLEQTYREAADRYDQEQP